MVLRQTKLFTDCDDPLEIVALGAGFRNLLWSMNDNIQAGLC